MPDFLGSFIAIIGLAALFGVLMRLLRQPLMIGYILTGVIAGPVGLALVGSNESLEVFSSLGVSLLLFLVGLGLNPRYIKEVGSVAVITGVAQIVFTTAFGLLIAFGLGYSFVPALYMSLAFTLSSTIVVLRLLQEKGDEDSLYGRIAIGFLLVQDLAAMAIFLVLSAGQKTQSWVQFGGLLLVKVAALALATALFVKFVLPRLERVMDTNRELTLLTSLALCFALGYVFTAIGFSFELGALFSGVLLSFSLSFREIASRVLPLRDFFLVLFFVMVGANVSFDGLTAMLPAVIVFSLFIVVGNPLIVYIIMIKMGYTRKTSLYAGLTVAQISEFSLIMIAVGIKLGHLTPDILSIATLVGIITIASSSYMMTFNDQVFKLLEPLLKRFSPHAPVFDAHAHDGVEPCELLLFGAHRLGGGILRQAQEAGISYTVVDFDPHLVRQLQAQHVVARFGSADDPVFLDSLDMSKLHLVISTIPDYETNEFLLSYLRKRLPQLTIVVVSHHAHQAEQLYKNGADYVVMPPYLGRRFMVDLFKKNKFQHNKYVEERERHLKDLDYLHS